MLPDAPEITDKDIERCRETGDFCPILFEWYKYVASLCCVLSNLIKDSPVVRKDINNRDYGILIGLINRAYRLMLANVALSHKGKFGEATCILDRCIFESCTIISWLCLSPNNDRFDRYVASGLRTELEIREHINKTIADRSGEITVIEKRMLNSVSDCLTEAGFDEHKIATTKKLPDLSAMLDFLGHKRLSYTVGQRVNSHHVHGTWVGLRYNYIDKDETGSYCPRLESPTGAIQYIYITYAVLDALRYFIEFIFENADDEKLIMLGLFQIAYDEITKLRIELAGCDFDSVE